MVALGLHLGVVGVAWEPGAGAPYAVMPCAAGVAFLGTVVVSWFMVEAATDMAQPSDTKVSSSSSKLLPVPFAPNTKNITWHDALLADRATSTRSPQGSSQGSSCSSVESFCS
jgi:hypothetical protein